MVTCTPCEYSILRIERHCICWTTELSNVALEPLKSFQNALKRYRTVKQRGYQRDVGSDLLHQCDADCLSWLRSTCVRPFLQKVTEHRTGRATDETPRIWWTGTAAASSLPFHAAGNYGHGTSDGCENYLVQCISSYTPSIKSLKHARMTASRASKLFAKERSLLVITMPTTPGQGALEGTALEEEAS
jgi:hypothetical protein